MNGLNGKKTYIVSALMVIVSLIHLFLGDISLTEFVSSDHMTVLLEAVGLSTLRVGIKKNQEDTVHEVLKRINSPHAG